MEINYKTFFLAVISLAIALHTYRKRDEHEDKFIETTTNKIIYPVAFSGSTSCFNSLVL